MNKKVIYSALGGALTLFLLGGLVYEVLLKDFSNEMMNAIGEAANRNPSMGIIVAAQLTLGLLLALLFNLLHIKNFKDGAIHGAWITFLITLWFDLWLFASFNFMTLSFSLVDILSNIIFGAVAGGVIGLIQGKVVASSLSPQH